VTFRSPETRGSLPELKIASFLAMSRTVISSFSTEKNSRMSVVVTSM
jgi:hypothetical protein